ncbi:TPR domain-containing protein [Candidatus Methylomirabilis lanthanidiphila]|uniref:TPR domain-containing protein n=1 Tax=Candidatus Methylomirabilis lanthanidiphila TaxID=2211376 RepID=A0A564ZHR2_9BACT|nr:TonB-dependent receptor [Candidatus Methylomirabilis lanthanidiphila]VUZ84202.1 TPR domain-containing protein [Candidatus Methylomirabilis lanthanidiphila]
MNYRLFSIQRTILLHILVCSIVSVLSIVPAIAQEAGRIVSVVGSVEVFRARQWQPVGLRHVLMPGDVVRTGPGSRAAILLSDEVQIKVNANSTLEITEVMGPPGKAVRAGTAPLQTILNLLKGELWSRSRGRPLQIRTPAATATIRGTEFDLSSGPDNESRLAVLEGAVEFRNPQGGVVVRAGEEATARMGEPPSKTILLKPLDAVQWSLYYPGILSVRDYPLSGVAPTLLAQGLVDAEQRAVSGPTDPEARLKLGEILFDLGRQVEARREFEKALTLDPGNPRALAGLGWVHLVEGRLPEALRAFQQATPSTLSALVGQTNALYRLDRFDEMQEVISEAKGRFPSFPQPLAQAALLYLIQGRVAEARQELEHAVALDPNYALAHDLRSNIALVRNEKDLAQQAAQQAIAANPRSASSYLNLSLAKQAAFHLDEALQAARKALALEPDNPMAMIQVSRLLFGMGRLSEALSMAEEARRRAPSDPLITSTWGFLLLTQVKTPEALTAFDQAIDQDSTRGEPHLGRGLALFRQGKTEEAVQEMWMATLLEPKVSLFWSYLGKALYEAKRYPEEMDPLAIAKRSDPNDPTPWFYDAIQKQTTNRPVEALRDMQQAIELNDNRAVYRSRLLLDSDLAARSASLGRIYSDLGFQQLALVEGWKSVNTDPSNFSAHRFLADSYAVLPRHEIARVSELLQSQLLQPINITPIQPHLAESNLFLISSQGPARLSFNEFNPLFTRNGIRFQPSGVGGENSTYGGEGVLSGIYQKASFSFGGSHFETDGFRKNSDQHDDIADAFLQYELSPQTSVQFEYRFRNTRTGDLQLNFFRDDIFSGLRNSADTNSWRVGLRHAFSPNSTVLGSFMYQRQDSLNHDESPDLTVDFKDPDQRGISVELQHLFQSRHINLTGGIGYFDRKREQILTIEYVPPLDEFNFKGRLDFDARHVNVYLYSYLNVLKDVTFTLGASGDFFKTDSTASESTDQFNPKLGITWNVLPDTTLRAAVFRAFKRTLLTNQTLEPTQVAGFNQFYDDFDSTESWRYGIAVDQKFSPTLFGGVELSRRDLEVPLPLTDPASDVTEVERTDWREDLARAYFFWTPHEWLALSTEYQYEYFKRIREFGFGIVDATTHRVPLGLRLFHPAGLSFVGKATWFHQNGNFFRKSGVCCESGTSDFWVVDTAVSYRLPKRYGFLTIGATNLFNRKFKYQETDLKNPAIQPDRTFFARLTLSF